MRAIAIDEFGGPELLRLRDLPDPLLGPDTVLVRVRAAGVNPVDTCVRAGGLAGAFPTHFPLIPGWDAAGVVEAVGPAVTGFEPGDEVFAYVRKDHIQDGTYAELVAAPLRTVARKPASASFTEAAAVPLAGLTAWQALHAAGVSSGDRVLVHAAAGGVGAFAVQLARVLGADVIGTASETNHEFVSSLGATPVAYGEGLVDRVRAVAPDGVTAVVDFAGGDSLQASPFVAKTPSRIVSVVDPHGVLDLGGRYVFVRPDSEGLAELARLIDAGDLTVYVSATYPLAEAQAAHEAIAGGHGRGKIVLEV